MTTATRHHREPVTAPPSQADHRAARARARDDNARYDAEYEAGRAGEPGEPSTDPAERAAYAAGRADTAREARQRARSAAGDIAGRSRRQVGTVASSTAAGIAGAASEAASGNWSAMGLVWGALGLIVLYLLLTKAGLASRVIAGVSRAATWFISPKTLPI